VHPLCVVDCTPPLRILHPRGCRFCTHLGQVIHVGPSLAKYWGTLGARPVRVDRPPTVTELRAAIPDDQYDPGEPVSEQYARLKRDRSKA